MPRSFRTSLALAAACLIGAAAATAARAQALDSLVLRVGALSAVTGLADAMADLTVAIVERW